MTNKNFKIRSQMKNTNKIENPEEEIRLKIRKKTFLNETALNQYVKWNALSLINFVDCRFEKIDFLGRTINFCKFKNSEFNDFSFRKCQFAKCTFENCRMVKLDLTRTEFRNCNFINCEFRQSDLSASDFWDCQFVEITFKDSNLNFIIVQDVEFWKDKKLIDIKDESNFEKILKDINLISTDQDEIENS
jgi:uncharacterized protein YjbI with pentapeptide repeats